MLEIMNNAADSEHWPASVLSPVCLILSSFAHTSAFILWRLTGKKKKIPQMHTRVSQAPTDI